MKPQWMLVDIFGDFCVVVRQLKAVYAFVGQSQKGMASSWLERKTEYPPWELAFLQEREDFEHDLKQPQRSERWAELAVSNRHDEDDLLVPL